MISTPKLAAALAVIGSATGCSAAPEPPTQRDQHAAVASSGDPGAESARRHRADGGKPEEIAPFEGEAALRRGDLGDARKWLGDARFAPAVAAFGYHMLGRLRLREGDMAGAGQAFDLALMGLADDASLWVDIARLRYRGGEQAQALDASRRALLLGPANPAALLLHAQLVRDADGNASALPLFERGLAAAPGDPDLLADYAATLGELGRARDMLGVVRRFATAAPGDRRALYLQAVLAARAGNHALARTLLQRSGDLDREMPAAILLLAVIDLDNDNAASAAQGFDRLLARQPDNARVQALLARALAAAGNHRELVARFSQTRDNAVALLVGRAYEHLGKRALAAPFLDRGLVRQNTARVAALPSALPLDAVWLRGRRDGPATVAVVRSLIRADRPGEARAWAEAWLRRHTGSAEARALAGDAALAAGDPRGALVRYRSAAAIARPWPLAKRIAAALEAAGDTDAAAAMIAAHLASEPNNAQAAAMLAGRSAARGDFRGARLLRAHAAAHGG